MKIVRVQPKSKPICDKTIIRITRMCDGYMSGLCLKNKNCALWYYIKINMPAFQEARTF